MNKNTKNGSSLSKKYSLLIVNKTETIVSHLLTTRFYYAQSLLTRIFYWQLTTTENPEECFLINLPADSSRDKKTNKKF